MIPTHARIQAHVPTMAIQGTLVNVHPTTLALTVKHVSVVLESCSDADRSALDRSGPPWTGPVRGPFLDRQNTGPP